MALQDGAVHKLLDVIIHFLFDLEDGNATRQCTGRRAIAGGTSDRLQGHHCGSRAGDRTLIRVSVPKARGRLGLGGRLCRCQDHGFTRAPTFCSSSFMPSSALPPNCMVGAARRSARTTVRWTPSGGANPMTEVAARPTRTERNMLPKRLGAGGRGRGPQTSPALEMTRMGF